MSNIINPIITNSIWTRLVDTVVNPTIIFDGIYVIFNGLKVVVTSTQIYTAEQFDQLDTNNKNEILDQPSLEKRLAYTSSSNNEFVQTKEYQKQKHEIAQTIFTQWEHEQKTRALPSNLKAIYFYFLKRLFNFRSTSESSYLCWYPDNL